MFSQYDLWSKCIKRLKKEKKKEIEVGEGKHIAF